MNRLHRLLLSHDPKAGMSALVKARRVARVLAPQHIVERLQRFEIKLLGIFIIADWNGYVFNHAPNITVVGAISNYHDFGEIYARSWRAELTAHQLSQSKGNRQIYARVASGDCSPEATRPRLLPLPLIGRLLPQVDAPGGRCARGAPLAEGGPGSPSRGTGSLRNSARDARSPWPRRTGAPGRRPAGPVWGSG